LHGKLEQGLSRAPSSTSQAELIDGHFTPRRFRPGLTQTPDLAQALLGATNLSRPAETRASREALIGSP